MKSDYSKTFTSMALGALLTVLPAAGKLGNTFSGTAHAQDSNQMAMLKPDQPAQQVSHPPTQNLPTPTPEEAIDTSKPWERKAAFRASTGRIVLHYGQGIREISARLEASSLTKSGYPAIAISGGPEGQVEVFVDRGIIRRSFNQDDLDSGNVGFLAMSVYDAKLNNKKPETVSLIR